MAEKKMTKKAWFEVIAEIVEASGHEKEVEILNFISHEVELLEKKSAKSGTSKVKQENVARIAIIKEALAEVGKPVQVSELLKHPALAGKEEFSSQRVSALLKQLKESGEVIRTEEKRKAYFSLA